MKISLFTVLPIVWGCIGWASAQQVGIDEDGKYRFVFTSQPKVNYKIESSVDLINWKHEVSVRGVDQINWTAPDAHLEEKRIFYRAGKVLASGVGNLQKWESFKANNTGRYKIGLIGDSYTCNRRRYAKSLKVSLADEWGGLGAGYLSFGYHPSAGKNGSIDDADLHYSLDYSEWKLTYGGGYGPCACHIKSDVEEAWVKIHVKKPVDTLKLMYVKQPGSAGFKYRIAQGSWINVVADASESLGVEELDLSAYDTNVDVELKTLGRDVVLIGAEAVLYGDGVVVHKLGVSGARSVLFASNAVAKDALRELDLDMAIIMFGTNEHLANHSPSLLAGGIRNIIDTLRAGNQEVEIVLVLPCYTRYENEVSTAYNLQDYGDAMRSLAIEYNAAFLDLTEVFGPAEQLQNLIDQGLMSSDRVHPTTSGGNSGGKVIANSIYNAVLGGTF